VFLLGWISLYALSVICSSVFQYYRLRRISSTAVVDILYNNFIFSELRVIRMKIIHYLIGIRSYSHSCRTNLPHYTKELILLFGIAQKFAPSKSKYRMSYEMLHIRKMDRNHTIQIYNCCLEKREYFTRNRHTLLLKAQTKTISLDYHFCISKATHNSSKYHRQLGHKKILIQLSPS